MKKFLKPLFSLIFLLFLFNCLSINSNVIKCNPWRNVTGYTSLSNELTAVRNCAKTNCSGSTYKKINYTLADANNANYSFNNTQQISISQQNQIIASANSWANSNINSVNDVIEYVKFMPNIAVSNNITYSLISIEVTYKTCTGVIEPKN